MLLTFAWRHLVRHWRANLALFVGLVLCAALLAGLPMYAATVAGTSLAESLANAYAMERNFEVRGDGLTAASQRLIEEELGDLLERIVEFRETVLGADREIVDAVGDVRRVKEVLFVRLWSFPLRDSARLLAGDWPSTSPAGDGGGQGMLGAAVGARAAEEMGLSIGDVIQLEELPYRLRIDAIIAPIDPASDLWWSDQTLLPFSVERVATNQVDNLYLSLVLPSETVSAHIPHHDRYWRVLLHWDRITHDNALPARDQLVGLQAALSSAGAQVRTGLVTLLDAYRAQLTLGRASFLLLTAQSLFAALYILGTIGAFLIDQSQREFAVMSGRGFSAGQIARAVGLEAGLLCAIAAPAGPLLAHAAFRLRSRWMGEPALQHVPPEAWWLAAVAVLCGWIALITPVYLLLRRNRAGGQQGHIPLARGRRVQRAAIDAFVLALGGLAYWQLRDAGTFLREVEDGAGAAVDPVLLLGPSLLLLALGFAFMRLAPVLLKTVSWLLSGGRGLVLPLALTRLGRDVGGPSRIVLLTTMTTGLVFFSSVFADSIAQRQGEIALYVAGADLRVTLPLDPVEAAADTEGLVASPGVRAAARAYRAKSRLGLYERFNVNARAVDIVAVDPVQFASVSAYAPGVGGRPMQALMETLSYSGTGPVPLAASPNALPHDAAVGSRLQYYVGNQSCEFEVRAVIDAFPTLEQPFMVANLTALGENIDIGSRSLSIGGVHELWLDVAPGLHADVRATAELQRARAGSTVLYGARRIAADAEDVLRAFRADQVARITSSAFALNAIVLAVLSNASLFLVQVFAARRRREEFGVLRALGLIPRQLLMLIAVEGAGMLALGLLAGTGVGYGLAQIMRPFISLALTSSMGGYAIDRLIVDWSAVGRAYGILGLVYAATLFLVLVTLVQSKLHRTLRLGDE